MNHFRHLDDQILFAVNSFARNTPGLHGLIAGYAKYGLALFLVLLAGALVAARHRSTRHLAATGWAALAPLLALGLNQPLGHVFREPRPYATHPHLLRLADVTTDFSFPSDHAVMAGAVAAGLLLAHRALGSLAAVAALLMAFARVYIAAHYPWDVVAGLVFGALVALVFWVLLRSALVPAAGWLRAQRGLRTVFATPSDGSVPATRVEPVRVR
ncbi:phosphatase PAP2 family protein [Pedococcus sp. NPDC057267]|uniref:phosphatase PAP2 family protein n=1 Tax=Pedococcus sp. NPDC057267 TaxID=3346077 RepID=UPI003644D88B